MTKKSQLSLDLASQDFIVYSPLVWKTTLADCNSSLQQLLIDPYWSSLKNQFEVMIQLALSLRIAMKDWRNRLLPLASCLCRSAWLCKCGVITALSEWRVQGALVHLGLQPFDEPSSEDCPFCLLQMQKISRSPSSCHCESSICLCLAHVFFDSRACACWRLGHVEWARLSSDIYNVEDNILVRKIKHGTEPLVTRFETVHSAILPTRFKMAWRSILEFQFSLLE